MIGNFFVCPASVAVLCLFMALPLCARCVAVSPVVCCRVCVSAWRALHCSCGARCVAMATRAPRWIPTLPCCCCTCMPCSVCRLCDSTGLCNRHAMRPVCSAPYHTSPTPAQHPHAQHSTTARTWAHSHPCAWQLHTPCAGWYRVNTCAQLPALSQLAVPRAHEPQR